MVFLPFAAPDLLISSQNVPVSPSECLLVAKCSPATVPLQQAKGCQQKKSQDTYLSISLSFHHNCCQLLALLCWLFVQVVQREGCLHRNLIAGVPSRAAMVRQQDIFSCLCSKHPQKIALYLFAGSALLPGFPAAAEQRAEKANSSAFRGQVMA